MRFRKSSEEEEMKNDKLFPAFLMLVEPALSICLALLGLAYRMKIEERLLTEQFGDEYRAYAGRSKKLIPGIW
jgi:protein-S-isoprenylcysteine O-methyltransferase Ste14